MRLLGPWLLGLTVGLLGLGITSGEPQDPPAEPAMSSQEIFETCAGCHEAETSSFLSGPHSALDHEGLAALNGADSGCAACHGDPTAHLESGGEAGNIFAFGDDDFANVKSQQCLTCHGAAHPTFFSSHHARAGLDCTSCHSTHSNDEQTTGEAAFAAVTGPSASCAECHADVFSHFEFNERHRLQEGTLDCSSCHDPHASSARWRLGGFKQEACVTCHADKSGPFVFEHGSQRVEGCVACHQPHGSPNRHMLTFQSVADLCYSCHAVVPGFHTRFTAETVCTNCHSTIHGSNFDPAFLK